MIDNHQMTVVPLCDRCTRKVLRPERCVALEGNPCPACAEDLELEQEIKELGGCTYQIHLKRRALRTAMNEIHDPLIHKFPFEISSQIFIQYAMKPNFDRHHIYDRKELLYLGAVCQTWRQLAWATPELWTSVFVGDRDISRWSHTEQLFVGWLERSTSLPLTITCHSNSTRENQWQGATNVLNKHSARWRDIHLEISACHLHHFCGSLGGTSTLRKLVLCDPIHWNRRDPSSSLFSMKCKPSPTQLTLTRVPLMHVNILWDNLTIASVNGICLDESMEIIRRCPRLETITLEYIRISGIFPNPIFYIPNTRTFLRRLRSLKMLNILDQDVIATILGSLCLPSLEQWIYHSRISPFLFNTMVSFIEYSSFGLKMLEIGVDKHTYYRVHELLHHLSSLESLNLWTWFDPPDHRIPATDELLDLLCAEDEFSLFLPHLRVLRFCRTLPFAWQSLPRIFASPSRRFLRVQVDHLDDEYIDNDYTSSTGVLRKKLPDDSWNWSMKMST